MAASVLTYVPWFPGMTLKGILHAYFADFLGELGMVANLNVTRKVSQYLQQLPVSVLEELLLVFIDTRSRLLASHAAFLLHPHMKRLVLDDELIWRGATFDVPFLFDAAGDRMSGLVHLQFPVGTILKATDFQRLCQYSPNLQILNLYCVKMIDDGMAHIANLKLKQLDLSYVPITSAGLNYLCSPDSQVRITLKKLNLWATCIKKIDYYHILAGMPQLEELTTDYSVYNLFDELPEQLQDKEFGLRVLTQNTGVGDIINYVKVSTVETIARTCPSMEKIHLSLNVPDSSMANCLKKFKRLKHLRLNLRKLADELYSFDDFVPFLQSISHLLTVLGLYLPFECNVHPLPFEVKFASLFKLVINDHETCHLSSDMLVVLLLACPRLEQMKLVSVVHLKDESASNVVNQNGLSCLKRMTLINCKNIGVLGINLLLKLPCLTNVLIKDCISEEDEDVVWDEKPDRVTLNFLRSK